MIAFTRPLDENACANIYFSPTSRTRLFMFLHNWNASIPIIFTWHGMCTVAKLIQCKNSPLPISMIPHRRMTSLNDAHPMNAKAPIVIILILFGISTLFTLLHLTNAWFPIVFSAPWRIIYSVAPEQPSNANRLIVIMLGFSLIFSLIHSNWVKIFLLQLVTIIEHIVFNFVTPEWTSPTILASLWTWIPHDDNQFWRYLSSILWHNNISVSYKTSMSLLSILHRWVQYYVEVGILR